MPHRNADAAMVIAVTDVVGVLVMMGSFLWLVEDARSVREGDHSTQSNIHHRQRFKQPFVAFAPRGGVSPASLWRATQRCLLLLLQHRIAQR